MDRADRITRVFKALSSTSSVEVERALFDVRDSSLKEGTNILNPDRKILKILNYPELIIARY